MLDFVKSAEKGLDSVLEVRRLMAGLGMRVAALCVAFMFVFVYYSTLSALVAHWSEDADMGHGFLVLPVVAWLCWRLRSHLCQPAAPSLWAILPLAIGALLHYLSESGLGLFAGALGLCCTLVGLVLAIGGLSWLRAFAFPLSLLVFALPKLAIVYNQITLPLQLLAAGLGQRFLEAAGIPTSRLGTVLAVNGHRYDVIEACSGFRFLIAALFLACLFSYLNESVGWVRFIFVASVVPAAILANAVRVAAIPLVGSLAGASAESFHEWIGWVVFVVAAALMVCVYAGLRRTSSRYAL